MKRRDFVRHLEQHGCTLRREGSSHTIYANPATGRRVAVPRHIELANQTASQICDRLGIPRPTMK